MKILSDHSTIFDTLFFSCLNKWPGKHCSFSHTLLIQMDRKFNWIIIRKGKEIFDSDP